MISSNGFNVGPELSGHTLNSENMSLNGALQHLQKMSRDGSGCKSLGSVFFSDPDAFPMYKLCEVTH